MDYRVSESAPLGGEIRVPGDKSISHRAVILSAIANGISEITGLLKGEDVLATLAAFRAMGINVEGPSGGRLTVRGAGLHGLQPPPGPLDMGNSGTAMRLLCGLLSAQRFESTLVGDASLSARPMARVTRPLTDMGACIHSGPDGRPPLQIQPAPGLKGIDYTLPVASAQVKSALLLAGLYAGGATQVREPAPTRDHTERMLRAFGCDCDARDGRIRVEPVDGLHAADIDVPADISSAAFFIVAASVVPGSELRLKHVGVNPTRTGVLTILRQMGADIECRNERIVGGEPVADILVRHSPLKGVAIDPGLVPLAIDEFPVLCIAAACADGQTIVSGAQELRHKESDRIGSMVHGLNRLGIEAEEFDDGMRISGGRITGGEVDSSSDHRVAMSFAVAGCVARRPVIVSDCRAVATSFPNFVALAQQTGIAIQVTQS